MSTLSILIVGVGGQGIILASKVLAEVAQANGQDVKMSEIHGMAQRGGSVVTQVKIGTQIHSPLIEKGEADIMLAFEQLEALRWLEYINPNGEMLVSTQVIEPMPVILGKATYPAGVVEALKRKVQKVAAIDALMMAEELGNAKVSNVVMTGLLAQKLPFPKESWLEALDKKVPAKLLEVNQQAFEKGYQS